MIRITKFRCNSFEELSYLVWAGNACVIIDPGFDSREFDTLKSKIFDRVRSELFFLSNLISIFVVYISKYRKYETCN